MEVKKKSKCSGCGNEGRINTCTNAPCQISYAATKAKREAHKKKIQTDFNIRYNQNRATEAKKK